MVRLHRCRFLGYKGGGSHPCWVVQQALDEQSIGYEVVKAPTLPRSRRKAVIEGTGQNHLPAIEFEDGSWYREDSRKMAEEIPAGRLAEKRSG